MSPPPAGATGRGKCRGRWSAEQGVRVCTKLRGRRFQQGSSLPMANAEYELLRKVTAPGAIYAAYNRDGDHYREIIRKLILDEWRLRSQ